MLTEVVASISKVTSHGDSREFLIVGAYALAFHGAPRFTGDLDIFVRPTLDNAARVLAAIRAFEFPIAEGKASEAVAQDPYGRQLACPLTE